MSFELPIIRQDFKILKYSSKKTNSAASENANQVLAIFGLVTTVGRLGDF